MMGSSFRRGGGRGIVFLFMFEEIINLENLLTAWLEFAKEKRGKPDVQNFRMRLMSNIFLLHRELSSKTYRHGGY